MSEVNDLLEWQRIAQLIQLLSDTEFHSGEELGELLGISRAAVWKYIKRLESLGIDIESLKGRGYRLTYKIELLDKTKITKLINASGRLKSRLAEVDVFMQIDSTNSFLLRQAKSHAKVCLAESQSSGRGRRGRDWVSPFAQNIYLSLGWQVSSGVSALKGLSLLVGCAIVRVLRSNGFCDVGLKWPNDVLASGRKLAGVLVEIRGDLSGDCELIIGIGLNYQMHIAEDLITQPWIDLTQLAGVYNLELPSRNVLAALFVNELFLMLEDYEDKTFAAYKAEWESYSHHIGQKVDILSSTASLSGFCRGVDDEGALLLMDEAGELLAVHAGEVSMRASS